MHRQAGSSHPKRNAGTRLGTAAITLALSLAALSAPAHAQIENEATAEGTHDGNPVTSDPARQSVPVAEPRPLLMVSVADPVHGDIDGDTRFSAGDTLNFRYEVTNAGNIRLEDVTAGEMRPEFGGVEGENAVTEFTLESETNDLDPGAVAVFTGEYVISRLDVLRAAGAEGGVTVSATAQATRPDTGAIYSSDPVAAASLTVPAAPALAIAKTFEITQDAGVPGKADAGDVITYSYTVTNTGNVAVEAVSVTDIHEGETVPAGEILEQDELVAEGPLADSSDGTPGDGVWDILGPGASAAFTYLHTVTQAEFEAQ